MKMYLKTFDIVCIVSFCTICGNAISLDDNTKQSLSIDNLNLSAPEHRKDLKRDDSRFSDPTQAHYKRATSATVEKERNQNGFQTDDTADHRYDVVSMSNTNAIPYIASSPWSNTGYGFRDRVSVGGYYSNLNNDYGYDRPRGPYGPATTVDLPGGYNSYGNEYIHSGYGDNYAQDIWTEKLNHLTKSNLIPIASAALLGIAAAFIFNPVLLQLGTISTGKRRKRHAFTQIARMHGNLINNSHELAYKEQRK